MARESKVLKEIKSLKKIVCFLYHPSPNGKEPAGLVPELKREFTNHLKEHKLLSNRVFALLVVILAGILGILGRVWF